MPQHLGRFLVLFSVFLPRELLPVLPVFLSLSLLELVAFVEVLPSLVVDEVVLLREVVPEVHAFRVLDLELLVFLRFLVLLFPVLEVEQPVRSDLALFGCVLNVQVGLEFVFSPKSHVAPGLAHLVRRQVVGPGEVVLQVLVLSVVDLRVRVSTEVAGQVLPRQMVEEH